jgi:hypothetical protein
MGCLMFFMFGGFLMVMGVYMSTLISYSMAFVTLMAGYLGVYMSACVAFVMMFLS